MTEGLNGVSKIAFDYLNYPPSYQDAISQGLVTNRTNWAKIGYNGAVTTEQDIAPWLGAGSTPANRYTFPTTELAMLISSSSNTDTGLTGMIKTHSVTAGGDQGSGYHANDILTITSGGGTNGKIKVLTVGGSGEVATYENYQGGSGYSAQNDCTTSVVPSGGTGCLVNILTVSTQNTGARTVTVYYLDDDFIEYSATVTLNGDSPELVATNVYRINNARVTTTGTSNVPVGNISIKNSTSTYGYITLGKTRQRQMIYTIPYNKTLYVTNISFFSGAQAAAKYCRFTTQANFDDKSGAVLPRGLFMPFHEMILNNTPLDKNLIPPTKLPATVDIRVTAFADATSVVSCALRGYTITA